MRPLAQLFPRFLQVSALVALGFSVSGFSPASAKITAPTTHRLLAADAPVRYMYPEVRLRKLHLVRPDLIPYPIEYEIYC
jgi:hypothetical protein